MRFFSILFALVFLAACSVNDSDETAAANRSEAESTAEAAPNVVDGVQVVEIEAGGQGFMPESIPLKAGVPARLVFHRTTDANCLDHVSVPEFGIEKTPLPLHEEVAVEFTPEEDGEFTFVCGMGMQSGTLVVSV